MPVVEMKHPTLDARVRMFRVAEEVDCFVIVTSSHIVIVDTFSTPQEALEMMGFVKPNLKTRELFVINTHQHYDHAWGNVVFAADGTYPAPIVAHQNSKSYLEQQQKTLLEMQSTSSRFENVKIIPPTQYFAENFRIKAGDLTLECIEAFGHSGDQVAIWIPEIETLLPADALEFPFPELEFGEFSALMNTFQAFKTLNPKVIAPCHGGIHDARLIDWNLAYFMRLEARAKESKLSIEALELPDLPERIGFSYADALAMLGLTTGSDFYRGFHEHNCKAVLQYLHE